MTPTLGPSGQPTKSTAKSNNFVGSYSPTFGGMNGACCSRECLNWEKMLGADVPFFRTEPFGRKKSTIRDQLSGMLVH